MGNIRFASIGASQALRRGLTLLDPVLCVTTPPAGILSAGVGAAPRDVAISLAPKTTNNLGMFPDAAVHPSDPHLSQLEQA